MEVCDLLVQYCNSLMPKKSEEQKEKVLKINENDLKKEKLTVLKPKRDQTDEGDEFFGGKNKKHQ
jgi:hypothetical protein